MLAAALLLALALACAVLAGEQQKLEPVASHSRVAFSLRHFTGTAEGKFKKYKGTLDFNAEHPEKSKISFEVDVASIDTDNGSRDKHLREEEYFDVANHPKMTFRNTSFRKTGQNKFMVTGPLTIKGHTKTVTIPVSLERQDTLWATGETLLHFESTFTLDRTEFGVGEASSLLGSEVTVHLDLEFRDAF